MKINAASRLNASNLSIMFDAFSQLTEKDQQEFITGIRFMRRWYEGAVLTTKMGFNTIHPANFRHMKQVMWWIRTYWFPDIAEGFSKVYRLQALDESNLQSGDSVVITPKLSMLSWTDLETPKVVKRKKTEYDVILMMHPSESHILWSFKIENHLAELKKASKWEVNGDSARRRFIEACSALVYVLENNKRYVSKEREIMIENERKPFKATIYKLVGK